MVLTIVVGILVLSVLIIIHELGHFISAKLFKMPVSEFAMGMGPKLLSYKGKNTLYSVRGIPMGGFVNIDGMEIDNPVENGFNTKPAWQRFIVLFAGVFMNFLLALVIIVPFTMMVGKVVAEKEPIIGYLDAKAPAAKYISLDDKIVEMDGQSVNSWEDVSRISAEKTDGDLQIKVLRDGETLEFDVQLMYSQDRERYLIGINRKYKIEKYVINTPTIRRI